MHKNNIKVKEVDLHKGVVQLLRTYQKTTEFIFFHIKNDVGRRRNNFFYDLKPLGILPGVPDICFLLPNGNITFLELKTKQGKLSDNQKKFIFQAEKLNHNIIVGYGWDDILKKIKKILNI